MSLGIRVERLQSPDSTAQAEQSFLATPPPSPHPCPTPALATRELPLTQALPHPRVHVRNLPTPPLPNPEA